MPPGGSEIDSSHENPEHRDLRDGKVRIPDGPGWGVEIGRGWLERAEYAISESQG